MNLSTKQYAQALYELTKDKPENEVSIVIEKFVKNLKQNGLLNKADDIIKRFVKIFNKENNIIEAKIFTSRKLDDKEVGGISDYLLKRYNAKNIEVKVGVDKNLKGGVRIILGEEIVDNSILGRLQKLKRAVW